MGHEPAIEFRLHFPEDYPADRRDREPGSRIETVGTRRERKEGGRESKDRERALVRAGTRGERRRGRGEGGQGRIESVGKRAHERAHKERGEEARERTTQCWPFTGKYWYFLIV